MHNSKAVFLLVVALLAWGGACGVLVSSVFTTTPVTQVTFLWLRFTVWIWITFICVGLGVALCTFDSKVEVKK